MLLKSFSEDDSNLFIVQSQYEEGWLSGVPFTNVD